MNNENNKLRVNYGNGVIVLPASVSDVIGSAKKTDICILVALLADITADSESIAQRCGVTAETVERAIAFWRGAGIISVCEEKIDGTKAVAPAAETEKPKAKSTKQGKRADLGELPSYSSTEIAGMVESDRDIALMIDECERALGKILRVGEIAKLIALRDYLGFAPDYIIALCEHCAKIGKNTVRYLETTAVALYDDGITDKDTLDEHLRRAQEKHDIEIQIRALFGMNMTRALSAKEKKFIDDWTVTFGYGMDIIKLAYEITVNTIKEPTLNYANGILQNWYASELKTEDDIKAQLEADAKAKGEPMAGKSFDSTDFFEAALRRSYGDSGAAPEIPDAEVKKKRK